MKIHNLILATCIVLIIAGKIHAASFDCSKASSEVEKMICSDYELSKLDETMNKAYVQALDRADNEERMIEDQRQWLKNERNACQNAECVKKAYKARMKELGWSSSGDEYVLVMSKNDCVCQHMLKIYNEDLKEYGEIKYDQHEEFKAIKWEKKRRYLRMEEGRKVYGSLEIDNIILTSQFDINNDGQVEIVVKDENVMFKGAGSDTISYFKGEASEYFKDQEFDGTKYKDAAGVIGRYAAGFDGVSYDLKELPKISAEAYGHYSIGPYFYINPLLYNGSYYIDMKDRQDRPAKWIVILKYTQENKPKDICYYLKSCEARSGTQGGE